MLYVLVTALKVENVNKMQRLLKYAKHAYAFFRRSVLKCTKVRLMPKGHDLNDKYMFLTHKYTCYALFVLPTTTSEMFLWIFRRENIFDEICEEVNNVPLKCCNIYSI
jgi:hypothetical protein